MSILLHTCTAPMVFVGALIPIHCQRLFSTTICHEKHLPWPTLVESTHQICNKISMQRNHTHLQAACAPIIRRCSIPCKSNAVQPPQWKEVHVSAAPRSKPQTRCR